MAVDIDAAFETLILRERAAVAAVTGQLAPLRPALRALASTASFSAFGAALAARQEFLVQTQEWVQYAVDTSVLTALADRVGLVFDALETYLPTIGEGVRTAHNLAATDAAFQASLSAAGLSLDDFVAALMLPTSDIAAGYLSFLYEATQFAPDNALVLAAYNQVQDMVTMVESTTQLLVIERDAHWLGQPDSKLVLVDAFRSLVREGELQVAMAGKPPGRKYAMLFSDLLLLGVRHDTSAGGAGGLGVEEAIPLASANLRESLANAGPLLRHAFGLATPAQGEVRVSALTASDKEAWVRELGKCIEAAATSHSAPVDFSDAAGAAQRVAVRLASKGGSGSPSPPPPPSRELLAAARGSPVPFGGGPPSPVRAGALPPPPAPVSTMGGAAPRPPAPVRTPGVDDLVAGFGGVRVGGAGSSSSSSPPPPPVAGSAAAMKLAAASGVGAAKPQLNVSLTGGASGSSISSARTSANPTDLTASFNPSRGGSGSAAPATLSARATGAALPPPPPPVAVPRVDAAGGGLPPPPPPVAGYRPR